MKLGTTILDVQTFPYISLIRLYLCSLVGRANIFSLLVESLGMSLGYRHIQFVSGEPGNEPRLPTYSQVLLSSPILVQALKTGGKTIASSNKVHVFTVFKYNSKIINIHTHNIIQRR